MPVANDLSFDYGVSLSEGVNLFNLVATDAVGMQDSLARQVTRDTSIPPMPTLGFISVSLPDANGVVMIEGQVGAVEAFSEVVIVNVRSGEVIIAIADANGAFLAEVNGIQGDAYTLLSEDAAGNQSETIEIDDDSLPDDPEDVAPVLVSTGVTSLFDSTSFLYTGANPIQTGVAPGTIEARRTAIIRGQIRDKLNNPLPGVTITIKDHPEYGQTLSRNDGMFDLAVNGGDRVTLNYRKDGYLPSQRGVDTQWQDFFYSEDVVMIPVDSKVTEINLLSTEPMQVATANTVTDFSGTRTAMVMIPQGTVATINLPGGGQQQLTTMNLRITEYTVGENGPETMPGTLPSTSGYTYAIEFTVDEVAQNGGIKVSGSDVNFNQTIYSYVDNYLDFPVGTFVPVGFYDPDKASWFADKNGRVIKIMGTTAGMADIDVDGEGNIASASDLAYWGITDAERGKLAEIYAVGKTLWRIPLEHFSTVDYNMPADFPEQPETQTPDSADPGEKPNLCVTGCIINPATQTLGENIAITGSSEQLHYFSDRQEGYAPSRTLVIPLTDATPQATLKRVDVIVEVAGQRTTHSVGHGFSEIFPNMNFTYVWDGKDAYGRTVTGSAKAKVTSRFVYPIVYRSPTFVRLTSSLPSTPDLINPFFGLPPVSSGTGSLPIAIRNDPDREIFTEVVGNFTLGKPSNNTANLGGWTLSSHHFYDPLNRNLYLGTGDVIKPDVVGDVLVQNAGGGQTQIVNGGPAIDLQLASGGTLFTADQNGGYYVKSAPFNRIHRIDPDGTAHHIAGSVSGANAHSGDGGLATEADFTTVHSMDTLNDGSLIVNSLNRIRKIDPNGIVTTIAGTGAGAGSHGDGGPAVDAVINRHPNSIVVGSDDSIYFVQGNYLAG
ncbi:MAG: hypothetical protein DRH08_14550, partial [Deltaproteobacteria bacterium]